MKNFLQIGQIDPTPLLHALAFQPGLWGQHQIRGREQDIILRFPYWDGLEETFRAQVSSEIQVMNYPAWKELPQALGIILATLTRTEGLHLGRVWISKVSPGAIWPKTSDRILATEEAFPEKIPPAVYYNRYEAVLQSTPGTLYSISGETVWMPPGSVWWINNSLEYEVINNGSDDRIHLVMDIHVAGRLS